MHGMLHAYVCLIRRLQDCGNYTSCQMCRDGKFPEILLRGKSSLPYNEHHDIVRIMCYRPGVRGDRGWLIRGQVDTNGIVYLFIFVKSPNFAWA
jgi:hypothetical protein